MKALCIGLLVIVLGSTLSWGETDYERGKREGKEAAENADTKAEKDYLKGYAAGIRGVLGGGTVYFPVEVEVVEDGQRRFLEIPRRIPFLTLIYDYYYGEWRLGVPEGLETYSFDPEDARYFDGEYWR